MPKRFDRIFKSAGEIDPRGLLHLLGALPIDSAATVTEARCELAPEPRFPDLLLQVTWPDGTVELWHIEFQLYVRGDEPERMLEYGEYAWLQYRRPVKGVLVLPVERFARGGHVPASIMVERGGLRVEYRFQVVRLWELEPALIFELGRPWLLPLVTLMRCTTGDLAQAAHGVSVTENRTLAETFSTLGGLRYDRNDLEELLQTMRYEDIIKPEWLRHSSVVAPVVDLVLAEGKALGLAEGRVEGRVEGRAEGRAEGVRRSIGQFLGRRFPNLSLPSVFATCQDEQLLELLLDELITAASEPDAAHALRRAAERLR